MICHNQSSVHISESGDVNGLKMTPTIFTLKLFLCNYVGAFFLINVVLRSSQLSELFGSDSGFLS